MYARLFLMMTICLLSLYSLVYGQDCDTVCTNYRECVSEDLFIGIKCTIPSECNCPSPYEEQNGGEPSEEEEEATIHK